MDAYLSFGLFLFFPGVEDERGIGGLIASPMDWFEPKSSLFPVFY